MSVGILKRESLTGERRSLSVRFETSDIVCIVKEFLLGNDRAAYINVLQSLATDSVSDDILTSWLGQLQKHVTIINQQCEGLIVSLIRLPWHTKDDQLVAAFEAFVTTLLSAYMHYFRIVLRSLVDCFVIANTDLGKLNDSLKGTVTKEEKKSFSNVHRVIQAISNVVPMTPFALVPLLVERFPYMNRDRYTHMCYVYNLLEVVKYMPEFRRAILEIIIDRMLKLDVYSPKAEIQEAEYQLEERKDLFREMEQSGLELDMENGDASSSEKGGQQGMAHQFADVLDVLLNLHFDFIRDVCYTDGELDWEATKKLYRELLSIFDKLVLTTHACCHVQFVMFYICSFRLCLSEGFVDYLWKKVTNPSQPPVIRQAAVSYIGSFLSRAAFVPSSMVTACFDIMVPWLHSYIDARDGSERASPVVYLHCSFYAVVQAVFYVFAFRHKELMEMPKGWKYLRRLNFERIVLCCLNPLKVCSPVVVRNFASVARNYQLAYCYTIIERNNRMCLPTVSCHAQSQSSDFAKNTLDTFFPFDPYVLVRSSAFITPIYREYKALQEEDDDDEQLDAEDVMEEDNVCATESQLLEAVLFGTSPGFKSTYDFTSYSSSIELK